MKKTELEIFKEIEEVEVAPDNEGEPLKSVKEILPYFCEKVEKALKRLDFIDNANPSTALESLERIDGYIDKDYDYCQRGDYDKDYNIIENYILKAQEQEKDNAYLGKIKTMMKQNDCVLRYLESADCFAVRPILGESWYKLTPEFVDDNVREEIEPLPLIEKIKQLEKENAELKAKAPEPIRTGIDLGVLKPKQYLKWEDLPFEDNTTVAQFVNFKDLRCALLCTRVEGKDEVTLRHYTDKAFKDLTILLDSSDDCAKQFFNNLQLERVE